ncbi:Transcriptional activator hap5 [Wickerhamomyces ciferrii]|uniref:Transcriptional activator hap5 n=1 Tax=Wickerhamomyces ciferrii (strain ATCC 14091 / BCRC 22168 / CBS 111 / JCM 3599 / NBRC 0793 / NRRL Y-1031 F-60-10) TaxID=1206466 RepID=K0KHV8_WICCF|nr:Transcriptional activator hap5 [Wickerhamomyces ciferrii]CCH40984.1 Transcriptional activator hap5 [Wickerhamomyces ciferrii]
MSQEQPVQNIEEDGAPKLHSFSTSQPTDEVDDANKTTDANETPEPQDVETSNSNETEITEESATKTKRRSDSTNDLNVIDIDPEEEEESSGTTVLQLSKIKKIFKTDPEHVSASEAAVFSTAIATELFIQYFTEQASLIARSEKRKKLQYKDFSSAVSNIEQLNFLSDTVPKTANLKKLVDQNKVNYSSKTPLEKGQQTLVFGGNKQKDQDSRKTSIDEEELPESDPEEVPYDNGEDYDDGEDKEKSRDEEDNNTEDEGEQPDLSPGQVLDKDRDVVMTE